MVQILCVTVAIIPQVFMSRQVMHVHLCMKGHTVYRKLSLVFAHPLSLTVEEDNAFFSMLS